MLQCQQNALQNQLEPNFNKIVTNVSFLTSGNASNLEIKTYVSQIVKHECNVNTCRQICSLKSDMKYHLKQKHLETDEARIKELLKKCTRRVVMLILFSNLIKEGTGISAKAN